MKKYLLLLMVAALSIACGGNNAEKKSDDAKSNETEVNKSESKKKKSKKDKTVEDIAREASEEYIEAVYDGDIELATEIKEEFNEWYEGLSRKEQKKVDKILAEYEEDFEEAEANSIPLIAYNYIMECIAAFEYGDMDYAIEMDAEFNEWYESLSRKEQRMADKVIEEFADELAEAAEAFFSAAEASADTMSGATAVCAESDDDCYADYYDEFEESYDEAWAEFEEACTECL